MRASPLVKYVFYAATIFLFGCSPHRQLIRIYDSNELGDINGQWILDDFYSEDVDAKSPEIQFSSSGRCRLISVPVNEDLVKWAGREVTENAEWRITKGLYNQLQVQVTLKNGTGIDFDVMKDRSGFFMLVHPLGDPDEDKYLVLKKVKSN